MKGSLRKLGNMWYTRIGGIEQKASSDKSEAQRILRDRVNEYEDTGRIFKPTNIKLSDALDIWFEECVVMQKRYGTKKDYENVIRHLKEAPELKKTLPRITPDDLQQYVNRMAGKYSQSTMKSQYAVLNPFFKWCVYPKAYIKDTPFQYVTKPKIDANIDAAIEIKEDSPKYITLEEFSNILDMLNDEHMTLVLIISMHTGLRLGEVCALTWNDIDLNKRIITVKKNMFYNRDTKFWEIGKTKNGKTREVAFGDTLYKELRKFKKMHMEDSLKYGTEYIHNYLSLVTIEQQNHLQITHEETEVCQKADFICIRENGMPITTQAVKTKIRRNIRKSGKGFDFHTHLLRHTHATMLIENGAKMKDVQERLGHSNISITMNTYAHVTNTMKKETVDIFEKAFNS